MENWEKVEDKLINDRKKIVIVSHQSPDGDSIGSSLGLFQMLAYMGHQVTVVCPDPAPSFLSWLPSFDKLLNYMDDETLIKEAIAEAEIIFCLDFNQLNRTGGIKPALKENKRAYFINLDHHQDPDDFADFLWSDTTASSTAEIVFQFIEKLSGKEWMNINFAYCIYTGILTDTGSFRFPATTPTTHNIAAYLLELGVQPNKVYQLVFDNFSADRLKLLGYALNDALHLYPKYNTAILALSKEVLEKYNYKKGDTEGIVNYPLSIKGIKMAILLTEDDEKVKLSFRSKGNFRVNKLAEEYFEGGGHVNAAGGVCKLSLKDTLEKIEQILPKYEKTLNA